MTGDLGASLVDAAAAPQPVAIAEPAAAGGDPALPTAAERSVARASPSLPAILMLAWALAAALLLLQFLRATVATRRLLRDAEPLRPERYGLRWS